MLPVSEVFGPTIQGEGPAAGRTAWFLRLGGCNLSCSWCDSAYTWDGDRFDLREQITPMTVTEICHALDRRDRGQLLVLTGGEPLLHQGNPEWENLLIQLSNRGPVHVETNGTIAPHWETQQAVSVFVTSPKQAHAGAHRGRQSAKVWPGWSEVPNAIVKVVVLDAAGVEQAVQESLAAGWPPHKVWVMPEGVTTATLNERWPMIAQAAAERGVNASHRLHVLAWGDERGH